MKIVIDMNLSPGWAPWLAAAGFDAAHWSTVGDPRASDVSLMEWAVANGAIVFTHDLDFGALLAATSAVRPSVIQVRSQDTFPDAIGASVINVLQRFKHELNIGALIVVEPGRNRVRLLPI